MGIGRNGYHTTKDIKEFINAMYGMMVTDFIQPEIVYDHGWETALLHIDKQGDNVYYDTDSCK